MSTVQAGYIVYTIYETEHGFESGFALCADAKSAERKCRSEMEAGNIAFMLQGKVFRPTKSALDKDREVLSRSRIILP